MMTRLACSCFVVVGFLAESQMQQSVALGFDLSAMMLLAWFDVDHLRLAKHHNTIRSEVACDVLRPS